MEEDVNDFIEFGVPLEPYEDDEIPSKKPINIEDQIVTDSKGRRRFHGAFTGGFSAGFFNTVGSEQGWTPSTFQSSRSSRAAPAEKNAQKPEDFMDEEDVGEFGIAPRTIRVTKEFEDPDRAKDKNRRKRGPDALLRELQGPIPGEPVLEALVVPAILDSIGIKMLKKLGWKEGQGIGPKVKKKPKNKSIIIRAQELEDADPLVPKAKVYGCSLPPSGYTRDSDDDDDDEEDIRMMREHLFAPDDVELAIYKPKIDIFGMGYQGLDKNKSFLSTLQGHKTTALVDRGKKLVIAGEAFGVGAFEKMDDSIYSVEDMSQYDFTLGGDEEVAPKKSSQKTSYQNQMDQMTKALEGFHLAKNQRPKKKQFPLPNLPKDYRPFHHSQTMTVAATGGGLNRHTLTANQRANLIDETPFNANSSALSLLSPIDRAKLEMAKRFAQRTTTAHTALQKTLPVVPQAHTLPPSVVDAKPVYSSDGRFKPFMHNSEKQERFEKYLKLLETEDSENFGALQPTTMTEWEKMQELKEFQKAAVMYRPVKKSMMSRFTPAQFGDTVENVKLGPTAAETLKSEEMKAAEKKMYGKLTRERIEWHPDNILCRRFNIPNPYPDSTATVAGPKKDKISLFSFLSVPPSAEAVTSDDMTTNFPKPKNMQLQPSAAPTTETAAVPKTVPANLEEKPANFSSENSTPIVPMSSNETTKEDREEAKPSIDFFKAIFEDSDQSEDEGKKTEESSSEEEEVVDYDKKSAAGDINSFMVQKPLEKFTDSLKLNNVLMQKGQNSFGAFEITPKVTPNLSNKEISERNKSPPRGVFANIDFDKLDNLKPPQQQSSVANSSEKVVFHKSERSLKLSSDSSSPDLLVTDEPKSSSLPNSSPVDAYYGPSLPPVAPAPTPTPVSYSNSRTDLSKKKSNKHKSKRKSKKKKDKHHKRKHRKKSDSSDLSQDSSTEDDEVTVLTPTVDTEKQLNKTLISAWKKVARSK